MEVRGWLRVRLTRRVHLSASERQSVWVLRCSPMEKSVGWQRTLGVQHHRGLSSQYSSGSRSVDTLRSASVMIQDFGSAVKSVGREQPEPVNETEFVLAAVVLVFVLTTQTRNGITAPLGVVRTQLVVVTLANRRAVGTARLISVLS